MNSNFRKTALLLGACALLSWGYAQAAKAESNSVASVKQTKTVKGTVSDAMGPAIGVR